MSQKALAHMAGVNVSTVRRWEKGETDDVRPYSHPKLARALRVPLDPTSDEHPLNWYLVCDDEPLGELVGRVEVAGDGAADRNWTTVDVPDLSGLEAIELVRRIEASDVGAATLHAIADGVDRLCRSYTSTPPAKLIQPVRAYQSYVTQLLAGRTTLAQCRELMVQGGWLSLLAATCYIDLHQTTPATVNLAAAQSIALEVGHGSLAGWVAETRGWQAVTDGRYREAVTACQEGLEVAPRDSSAFAQLCMQKARAVARMGQAHETYQLLDDCAAVVDRMPTPIHPEHHYAFDPRRLLAYSAGALVYLGDDDGVAEDYARRAVAQYDVDAADGRWVRRLALARVDLAIVLARRGEPVEAAALGHQALASGRVAASDAYQLTDLDRLLSERYPDVTEASAYSERYAQLRSEIDRQRELPPSRNGDESG